MRAPIACTIASNNYLAYARVFTGSFLEHHPDGRVFVLIADRPHDAVDYDGERFTTVFAHDLDIPAFASFAFRYSILELNTAVKPYFLRYLHEREEVERLCYFDPDVLVLEALDGLYERLERADLLLTPHVTEPLADGARPSESDLLKAGVYNLGFLGLRFSQEAKRLLAWWQERLYEHCLHRVEENLFVDQRWMDLAPALVADAAIVREPGFNAAYWNLAHRRLEQRDGRWRVDGGAPLYFFHFSGFDPDDPESLSRYQDRYRLSDRPDAAPLFLDYRDRLEGAGHAAARQLPYAYGRFADGTPVPATARETLRRVDPRGERWPDPFDVASAGDYRSWLLAPVELGPALAVPRLAHCLWEQRRDLQQRFPDLAGGDAEPFVRWLADSAATDLPEPFAEALRGAARPLAAAGEAGSPSIASDRGADAGAHGLGPWATALQSRQIAYLAADAGHDPAARPVVPRLAMTIRDRRRDLQRAFPDPLGASRLDFAVWFATYGRREYFLPPPLVRPVLRSLPWRAKLHVLAWSLLKRRRPGA